MTTPELPEFVYNVQTCAARIGSQIVPLVDGVCQTTNGYGQHFITLTIPVSRIIVEGDPTGPVNPANPFATIDR